MVRPRGHRVVQKVRQGRKPERGYPKRSTRNWDHLVSDFPYKSGSPCTYVSLTRNGQALSSHKAETNCIGPFGSWRKTYFTAPRPVLQDAQVEKKCDLKFCRGRQEMSIKVAACPAINHDMGREPMGNFSV